MERRYMMQNSRLNIRIEVPYSSEGFKFLKKLRKKDNRFKYCRIVDALQAYPSNVDQYVVFDMS